MTTFLLGALAAWAVAFVVLLVVDMDLRRAVWEVLLAILLGPGAAVVAMTRRGPRMARIHPRALERFLQQRNADMGPAWLLSYGGRGVLFIRRRPTRGWWRNNVPNRAVDASRPAGQ